MIDNHILPSQTLKIAVNNLLCRQTSLVQYRFPRSRKARIRKKWRNRFSNYRIKITQRALKIGDTLYVSSEMYEKLEKLGKINDTRI